MSAISQPGGGTPGTQGPPGPSPLLVTGLTGGSSGCICYLVSSGVVRDLDNSMRGKLRDSVPLFFKHPNGSYYQLAPTGIVAGAFTGQTSPYAMILKQKTSNTDKNVNFYDTTSAAAYSAVAPTLFLSYLEAGRALNATDLLNTFRSDSIRFADTSGTPVQTVQDKILTTGTYAYTDSAAIPAGIWTYPWGAFNSTYRFSSADTTLSPSGGVAEFNNTAFVWQNAAHAGITNFADGGIQAVIAKGDGNRAPMVILNRMAGTSAAPVGVGVYVNSDNTAANRYFGVGYFNASSTWTDCTDPASGLFLAPTLDGGKGFRVVIDTIGSFIGAKVWPLAGGVEPTDYNIWGWQSAVSAAGASGVGVGGGRIWVTDFGVYWAAPGTAPRGP